MFLFSLLKKKIKHPILFIALSIIFIISNVIALVFLYKYLQLFLRLDTETLIKNYNFSALPDNAGIGYKKELLYTLGLIIGLFLHSFFIFIQAIKLAIVRYNLNIKIGFLDRLSDISMSFLNFVSFTCLITNNTNLLFVLSNHYFRGES